MKWISLQRPAAPMHEYDLVDNDAIVATLHYNPLQPSVRLHGTDRQGLYFIESAGFRSRQVVFKNEYGFETGRMVAEDPRFREGTVELNETTVHFTFSGKPLHEVTLYKKGHIDAALVCQFKTDIITGRHGDVNKALLSEFAGLVLGLCWNLLAPPARRLEKNLSAGALATDSAGPFQLSSSIS